MAIQEIPLTADNQQFSIIIAGATYRISIIWRETCWVMDMFNDRSEPLISGVPLVTGADLMAQYEYMGLGFKMAVVCDDEAQEYPTKIDLGSRSHLLVSTE